jgi:nicotinamide riboside kinase
LRRKEDSWNEWQTEEFIHIASEQYRSENELARNANRVLICDTDAFATTIWHRRYMGSYSPEVQKVADKRKADLYIVTGDEIPFVQDGTRDGEHIRHEMQTWFIQNLKETNRPYIVVRGTEEKRLQQAIEAIEKISIK